MTIRNRMNGLEKAVHVRPTKVPRNERVQVLKSGETVEQRATVVIEKYGTTRGVIFARIKGRD